MSHETILAETSGGICQITLNRPHRLNAWTPLMSSEMSQVIAAANDDDDVEAIVVTGAGRGFCAGADIGEVFQARSEGRPAREAPRPVPWVELVRGSKPMVAAINGAAVGVGLTQVLPMDFIVASKGAKLSMRFIKMGLVPELASSHFLCQRVGFGNASELMLSGRTLEAEEALALGLVDRVTEPDALLPTARAIAKGMGENPQSAVRIVKKLITQNASASDLAAVQRSEGEALAVCYTSPEHKEAIAAFMEKRAPNFRAARGG